MSESVLPVLGAALLHENVRVRRDAEEAIHEFRVRLGARNSEQSMTPEDAFVYAILGEEAGDTTQLVFADWLEERAMHAANSFASTAPWLASPMTTRLVWN
jgi:uncharacterized protein (TIGR02996 family)